MLATVGFGGGGCFAFPWLVFRRVTDFDFRQFDLVFRLVFGFGGEFLSIADRITTAVIVSGMDRVGRRLHPLHGQLP